MRPRDGPAASDVVVGFDESDCSMDAVRWAAIEAQRRGFPLVVVQSWREPVVAARACARDELDPPHARSHASAALEAFVWVVRREHPQLEVKALLVDDPPESALTAAADGAALLVVGSRGRGGFRTLLLGSVVRSVVAAARCPVVVVRGPAWRSGHVVVGVDGTEASLRALTWAAAYADRRGCGLEVLQAWTVDRTWNATRRASPSKPPAMEALDDLRQIVHAVLGDDLPAIELAVSEGLAASALLRAAESASLVVLGDGGGGAGDIGPVTWQLLDHAPCSVAVVRGGDR